MLAGRHAGPIEKLATELGLPMRVFDLENAPAAAAAIVDMAVVANCAGPFAATSAPMIDACLASRAHGYYTPSMLLGERCVEQLPGSTSIHVE